MLHHLPSDAEGGEHAAAQAAATSSPQALHEAETAALALAVLVRLTAHAGAHHLAKYSSAILISCSAAVFCLSFASQ